ncbi:hypothetical protein ACROYT_G016135, partial [Oculina patagonica]
NKSYESAKEFRDLTHSTTETGPLGTKFTTNANREQKMATFFKGPIMINTNNSFTTKFENPTKMRKIVNFWLVCFDPKVFTVYNVIRLTANASLPFILLPFYRILKSIPHKNTAGEKSHIHDEHKTTHLCVRTPNGRQQKLNFCLSQGK